MESGNDESGRGEHEEMAEKNREEKRGKRAPFNLGARKHWINDSREREKGTFLSTVSTAVTVYPWIRKDTRDPAGEWKKQNGERDTGVGGTRHARKRVFNVFSSGAEPLGAHLDGG